MLVKHLMWQEQYDESSNIFYINSWTQEVSYERPLALDVDEADMTALNQRETTVEELYDGWQKIIDIDANVRFEHSISGEKCTEQPPMLLPPGWIRCLEEDTGTPYFYNEELEKSTYERPSMMEEASPSVWEEVYDEETGETYFYNNDTGETSWTNPTTGDEATEGT